MCLTRPFDSIGACIRAVRERRRLDTQDAAALLGVHRVTLNRYENGRRQPTAARLACIAAILAVPPALLYPESCTCEALAQLQPFEPAVCSGA
jgi:transcriptional regulator with XRE-family HTH domain